MKQKHWAKSWCDFKSLAFFFSWSSLRNTWPTDKGENISMLETLRWNLIWYLYPTKRHTFVELSVLYFLKKKMMEKNIAAGNFLSPKEFFPYLLGIYCLFWQLIYKNPRNFYFIFFSRATILLSCYYCLQHSLYAE